MLILLQSAAAGPGPSTPITLVQSSSVYRSQVSTAPMTFPSPLTAGNLVVVVSSNYAGGYTAISGTLNGSYPAGVQEVRGSNNYLQACFIADVLGGSETIKPTGGSYVHARAYEFAGVAKTNAKDAIGAVTAGGTVTASTANSAAGALVIAAYTSNQDAVNNGYVAPTTGYTNLDVTQDSANDTAYLVAYKIASGIETSTATETPTVSPASALDGIIITFKAAAIGPKAYELIATPTSISVASTSANLARAALLQVTPAAYAVTGLSANLARAVVLSATPGAYAVSTVAANLARGVTLSAVPNTVAVAALDAVLSRSMVLSAVVGAYTITPLDVTLQKSGSPAVYELIATPAALAITTQSATLAATRTLAVTQASYAIAAQPAALSRAAILAASPVAYAIATAPVNLGRQYVLAAMPGAYAVASVDAALLAARIWAAAPGEYSITPLPVDMTADGITIDPTTWIRYTIAPEVRHWTMRSP